MAASRSDRAERSTGGDPSRHPHATNSAPNRVQLKLGRIPAVFPQRFTLRRGDDVSAPGGAGGQYVDRDLASKIAISPGSAEDPLQALTLREIEILRLLGQGKSITAISEGLGIAYKTVANICTQMKVKLGVDRTADLIRLAVETLKG